MCTVLRGLLDLQRLQRCLSIPETTCQALQMPTWKSTMRRLHVLDTRKIGNANAKSSVFDNQGFEALLSMHRIDEWNMKNMGDQPKDQLEDGEDIRASSPESKKAKLQIGYVKATECIDAPAVENPCPWVEWSRNAITTDQSFLGEMDQIEIENLVCSIVDPTPQLHEFHEEPDLLVNMPILEAQPDVWFDPRRACRTPQQEYVVKGFSDTDWLVAPEPRTSTFQMWIRFTVVGKGYIGVCVWREFTLRPV